VIPEYRRGLELPPVETAYLVEQRRRAVLNVCALAANADDADHVLEVLGLRPTEGRPTEEDDRCS